MDDRDIIEFLKEAAKGHPELEGEVPVLLEDDLAFLIRFVELVAERAISEALVSASYDQKQNADEFERLRAQLEVTNAALTAAVCTARWQSSTNHELNQLNAENIRLHGAIVQTIEENGHLADGDNCTLILLKRAIECTNDKDKGREP